MNKQVLTGTFTVLMIGAAAVFCAMPLLFSGNSPSVVRGVVEGATVSETQGETLVPFRSLIRTQQFRPFDPAIISADSVVVLDTKTGDVLLEKNADTPHTLASLTKLITAAMLYDRGFTKADGSVSPTTISDAKTAYKIPIPPEDPVSKLPLTSTEIFSSEELLRAMLIASANDAAFALVASQGFTPDQFVEEMNKYLASQRAVNTVLYDPSGLHYRNTSTAREFATLVAHAFSFLDIRAITQQSHGELDGNTTGTVYTIRSTNELLENTDAILGGKTGYLDASGYTLALLTQHTSGRELVVVLFGATSKSARVDDALTILSWLSSAYEL